MTQTQDKNPKKEREREVFRAYLQKRGLKLTAQRAHVLEAFLGLPGHVSAEELHQKARERLPGLGFATVYRTLRHLRECGLARPHDFGAGRMQYEVDFEREHHDHLICEKCGALVEFLNPRIEALQEKVGRQYGYVITSHRMQLFGVCPKCRRARA